MQNIVKKQLIEEIDARNLQKLVNKLMTDNEKLSLENQSLKHDLKTDKENIQDLKNEMEFTEQKLMESFYQSHEKEQEFQEQKNFLEEKLEELSGKFNDSKAQNSLLLKQSCSERKLKIRMKNALLHLSQKLAHLTQKQKEYQRILVQNQKKIKNLEAKLSVREHEIQSLRDNLKQIHSIKVENVEKYQCNDVWTKLQKLPPHEKYESDLLTNAILYHM